ncbi:MAG: PIN domain-containing protein [Deltaproteobacteria bacterium]|nr:PIN domain-containing protein [Deltaproteobacteria bacterium]MBW2071330.1 PIN domain-containing protein [Deltaproteobacteria bacterium]
MKDKTFVDTNILVYAHDIDAGSKREAAVKIVSDLWESRLGVISTQVLQEFYVAITRKIPVPLDRATVRMIMRNYLSWEVAVNDAHIIFHACEIEEAHRISFWDALIISAAFSRNAATILTEDLNHGQIIEGIQIQNPFKL